MIMEAVPCAKCCQKFGEIVASLEDKLLARFVEFVKEMFKEQIETCETCPKQQLCQHFINLILQKIQSELKVRIKDKYDSKKLPFRKRKFSRSFSRDLVPPKSEFVCEFCRKEFAHKGDYNKHLRIHTKEQPFSCTLCGLKFAHTSNLHRHFRIHSGFKPFVCEKCGKSFSRNDKLVSHQKSRNCKNYACNS